jgi:putative aldouronate transport system substrate-binding protein
MRWIDYVWSDEGAAIFSFGIKGTSWDVVNGKKTFIGEYTKLDNALMAKMMIQPNVFPFRYDVDAMNYMYDRSYPEGNAGYKLNAAWKVYPLPVFAYTKEEQETLKDWNANVAPLITQYRDGIAVGTRPLSDWDELVSKVKGMGYDKYTNVIKAAYARYKVLLSK